MQKNRMTSIRDYIVKHSKLVFPVIVIAVAAVTVSVALNASNAKAEPADTVDPVLPFVNAAGLGEVEEPGGEGGVTPLAENENVPLAVNEDERIQALVLTYYNAKVYGDMETLASVYDEISERDMLDYMETAKYLEYIPALEVYTKPGLAEGDTIVYVYYRLCFVNHENEEVPGWQTFYVCTDENGDLYFKSGDNITEEEAEYVIKVSGQDDVIEVNNRVSVEFNELIENHPEMYNYMTELKTQINTSVGVALAERNADTSASSEPEGGEEGGAASGGEEPGAGEGGEPAQDAQPPVEAGPQYATATTTVNVRKSDSELADKLGKVSGGTRLQVQEVGLNGWTKVVYEGNDGYIKSEFLNMEENVAGQQVIGTVTATANINVRSAATTDAESLGILSGGDSLDLLANEGEWCKVSYEGRIGYVKTEYVTQQ